MTYDGLQKASSALSASPAGDGVEFEISPSPAFVDEDVRVCVRGLPAAALISIQAATDDDQVRRWSSQARFRADSSGVIDVSVGESLGGSYLGVAPLGNFWSMESADANGDSNSSFAKNTASPDRVDFEALPEGRVLARASLARNFLAAGTVTRDLKIPNEADRSSAAGAGARAGSDSGETTVGRLFIPPGHGPHPAVIVLSGSGGGFDVDKAAVLSRHGFATLALAYFGIAALPAWLHRIPLEYFKAALTWLHAQPEIDARRNGILGVSRGAELALLLGATLPQQIRAIVAYTPSSVAWAASGRDKTSGELIPCWTWRGKPVPFAPLPLRGFMWRSAFPVLALKRPVMFRNLFRAGLRNREAVDRAAIPVENIRGPLLLISGGDDHLWPATEMSEAIIARLKRHGSTDAAEQLLFAPAGHMLRYPPLPVPARHSRNKHLRGARFSFGGTPEADAEAQEQAWRRSIAFLRANL